MREIKFRAWDGEQMHHDWMIFSEEAGEVTARQLAKKASVVMQFTGLRDKNGREIYEGDILESEYTNVGDEGPRCHPVVWGNGRWNCDHSVTGCCKPWRGDLNGHHQSEVIIGNIWEHPNLLESK